jgi:hypothetical protein
MFEGGFRSYEGWELKAIMYSRGAGDLLSGADSPPQYTLVTLHGGSRKIFQTAWCTLGFKAGECGRKTAKLGSTAEVCTPRTSIKLDKYTTLV